jgi:hypothetical protein
VVNLERPALSTRVLATGDRGVSVPRSAVVLGPPEDTAALTDGLTRFGVTTRSLDPRDPAVRSSLLASRPDLLIVQAATAAGEASVRAVLDGALDTLRSLSVPVVAACGAVPPGDLHLLADDVLLPPFDPAEALLRASLITRRRGASGTHLVSAGPLTVDVEGFRVWLAGQPVSLTYTEFQLLRLLLLNRSKVLTRQMLLNKIWGYDYLGGLRTVDVHIRRLRAKIEGHAPDLIETVRHVGYRIE